MAFITGAHVTSFDSKGFKEMYTYTPSTEIINCVSCPTEGKELTGDVEGSLNGRYIAEDGRTFFYTPDSLVSYDTNHLRDIYEFVEGRPRADHHRYGEPGQHDDSGRPEQEGRPGRGQQ